MTDPTPEYLRGRADNLDAVAAATLGNPLWHKVHDAKAALRAAADRLEVVQSWADHADPVYADLTGLYAILAADTAPQEGRDE